MLRTKLFQRLFLSRDVSLGLRGLLSSRFACHLPPGGRLGTGHRSEGDLGHSSALTRRGSRTGKKGAPINKFTACPFRSKPFSLCFLLSKHCITPKYTQGAFGLAKICRWPKRTAKRQKPFIRSDEAPGRTDFETDCPLSPCEPYLRTAKGENGQKRRPYK